MSDQRGHWQDWKDDRWDDHRDRWDDWADNNWDHDHDWDHDHWHGHYDQWWDHMWEHHPVAMGFGVTAWGVNRMSYWFGTSSYDNPYYSGGATTSGGGFDYSQPLETYEQVAAAPAQSATAQDPAAESADPSTATFGEARQAFYDANYDLALSKVDAALALAKNDAALHEFRSLVLFAQGKYRESAAAIYAVLAVGPGWDWTTLSGMYANVDVYTQQLRALEEAVNSNEKKPELHFLLAYHYITTNATDPAINQLTQVIELQPKDAVATQVLEMIGGPAALPATVSVSPPPSTGKAAPAIDKAALIGEWKAKGSDGSMFKLTFAQDSSFIWTYSEGSKSTKIAGAFAIEGNTLAMEPDAGGTMVAELTPPTNGKFHFQTVGSAPGDPGLNFAK